MPNSAFPNMSVVTGKPSSGKIQMGDSVRIDSGLYNIEAVVLGIENDVVIVEFGNDRHCRIPMDINCIEEVDQPDTEE